MSDRLIELQMATCPECGVNLGLEHAHGCQWQTLLSLSMRNTASAPMPVWMAQGLGNHSIAPYKQRMDYSKVIPSLGDRCPRKGCGMLMAKYQLEEFTVYRCPVDNYEAKERTS